MSLLLFGHAPPGLAIPLWIAIAVVFGVLWAAIGRQADRERAREQAERAELADQLDNLTGRVEDIEHYLHADREATEQWPNSAPDQ